MTHEPDDGVDVRAIVHGANEADDRPILGDTRTIRQRHAIANDMQPVNWGRMIWRSMPISA